MSKFKVSMGDSVRSYLKMRKSKKKAREVTQCVNSRLIPSTGKRFGVGGHVRVWILSIPQRMSIKGLIASLRSYWEVKET